MADESETAVEARALEVLKSLGKTLSQINLYSAAHPAVRSLLADTAGLLATLLAEIPGGELAYSIDGQKLVANGRIIGTVDKVPNSLPNAFSRFKLHSVVLRTGVSEDELAAFCDLAAMRPEAAKGVEPTAFLAERKVANIILNEAMYAKVDKADETAPGAALQASGGSGQGIEELVQTAEGRPIEDTIAALVSRATPDAAEQARLMEAVMRRVRDDLDKKVAEATTELKRQKQTLENEATRTQGVLETMSEGVVVIDDQGKVLMMNPEAENLFGSRLSEMAGKPVAEGGKEEHLVALAKDLVVPQDRPVEKSAEVKATDDTRRTLRASTVMIQNEAGKTVGMVSALSDKAKQREFDRMEREFIAHVTHELRSPLTAIRAALEIIDGMMAGKLDAEAGRMFSNALRNTDRLETLISSILDFSKIESGQMTVLTERASAAKIGSEAVESLRPWTVKKGLRVEFQDRSGGAEVMADVPRTVQVIVNLLSNAIKFTPKGGSITVTLGPAKEAQEPAVLYTVRDTGPGIPKDQQDKVFEKFVQIASGERHVGGTGLGLAIAKALIHLQKGKMWLESEPGRGAAFMFTLPVYKPPADEVRRAAPPPPRKAWWKRLLGL